MAQNLARRWFAHKLHCVFTMIAVKSYPFLFHFTSVLNSALPLMHRKRNICMRNKDKLINLSNYSSTQSTLSSD